MLTLPDLAKTLMGGNNLAKILMGGKDGQTCYHLGYNIAKVMGKKMYYIYLIKFVINN